VRNMDVWSPEIKSIYHGQHYHFSGFLGSLTRIARPGSSRCVDKATLIDAPILALKLERAAVDDGVVIVAALRSDRSVAELQATLNAKLCGHYRRYGRPTNYSQLVSVLPESPGTYRPVRAALARTTVAASGRPRTRAHWRVTLRQSQQRPQAVTPKTRLLRRAKMIALKVASRRIILSAKKALYCLKSDSGSIPRQ
jgi:hypothetical protein